MEITFEKAIPSDLAELKKTADDAFAEDGRLYGSLPPICIVDGLIKQLIDARIMYDIKADGKIIGGLVLHPENGECRLGALFISTAYHNMGIGGKALRFIENEMPAARRFTLDTPYKSFRNHHFYEKHGYRKYGETEPEENGFYLWLYEKIIGSDDDLFVSDNEFNSEYCNVRYIPDNAAVLLTWKKRAVGEDYRAPTTFAANLIRRKDGCLLIIDARNGFEDDKADVEWGFNVLLPELSDAGCKEITFIMNGSDDAIEDEMSMWTAEFRKYFTVRIAEDYGSAAETNRLIQ